MGRIHSYKRYLVIPTNGYSGITVGAVAVGLGTIPSTSQFGKANACTITVVGNTASTAGQPVIYYKANGETPAVGSGLALFNGALLELFESEVADAKFICADGNNQRILVEFANV